MKLKLEDVILNPEDQKHVDEFSVNRYCFVCKTVTKFIDCGNCGRLFCPNHVEWEEDYDEWNMRIIGPYPIHRACI